MDEKTKQLIDNPHYVCTGGCGQVSQIKDKCRTPKCFRNRNPLTECNCIDGNHDDLPERNKPKDM